MNILTVLDSSNIPYLQGESSLCLPYLFQWLNGTLARNSKQSTDFKWRTDCFTMYTLKVSSKLYSKTVFVLSKFISSQSLYHSSYLVAMQSTSRLHKRFFTDYKENTDRVIRPANTICTMEGCSAVFCIVALKTVHWCDWKNDSNWNCVIV